jgi:MFS family permease
MTLAPGSRISIVPILAINFVGSLGFSIVLPFLVYLVIRLGGNALIYGVMGATYSFFQLIGAPVLGRWSDRFGRRRVLLLSHLGTLASWGIFLVALAVPARPLLGVDSPVLGAFTLTIPLAVLFLARALDGITGGNVSVANAYLADITPESERGANFGKLAVSSNLGFIVGPALAGVLGATVLGEMLPVLAALGISLFAAGLIALKLPEPERCELARDPEQPNVSQVLGPDQKQCYELTAKRGTSLRHVLRVRGIRTILALHFLVFLAFNFFYVAFPVHAAGRVGWSLTQTGVFFALLSLMMAAVQGPLLSHLSQRTPDRVLLLVGSAILTASFAFFWSTDPVRLYAGAALLSLGNGLMWPSLLALLSKAAPPRMQGAVQGFAGSSSAVASIAGLIAGGALYGASGGAVFGIAAGITGAAFLLAVASKVGGMPR